MINIQNLKAIFFDLDNVLVFSEVLHFKAWQSVLEQCGYTLTEAHFQEMIGKSDGLQAREFEENFKLKQTAESLWHAKQQTFFENIKEGFGSPLGRNAFIQKYAKLSTVGVVSSSSKRIINEILNHEKISSLFEFVIAYEDCARHKPDPLPYQHALEKAKIAPHQALVIEDSLSGILAAQNAGIPVVGILKDQTPDQIVKNVKYFNDFNEIDLWLTA